MAVRGAWHWQRFFPGTTAWRISYGRLTFEDAGDHELKGVPDPWHLYLVVE